MGEALPLLAFLLLTCAVPLGLLAAARVFRVRAKSDSPLKRTTYECGEEPAGVAWVRFHPRYFVVALLFVLFGAEVAFLFPWGVAIRELSGTAIVEMIVFVGVLMLGWAYAVRKGTLRWQ